MAGEITIKVDTTTAMARFSPAGIPTAVRNNLRRVLPSLTKKLGGIVENKLNTGLKTRRRLVVKKEIVDPTNQTAIYGRVRTISTMEPFLLPTYLEEGTKRHPISIKNAPYLVFFWERMGHWVRTKEVMHPGFKGIHYSRDAFAEMEGEIRAALEQAVRTGAREA